MSLFQKPTKPAGRIFMLRGEPGTGKTRFAFGLSRLGKPIAVIGSDRGLGLYAADPAFGEIQYVETRDAEAIDAALCELAERRSSFFGAVVVDTITDWWNAEQKRHEVERDGKKVVPMRAWREIRDAHERRLRALAALSMHVVLISEERPIYERVGDELKEVGSREDTDKKDAYLADVRLRFFAKDGRPYAEVLKDRTGRFAMGAVVEDPSIEMWLGTATKVSYSPLDCSHANEKPSICNCPAGCYCKGNTCPSGKPHPLEGLAKELIDHLGEIDTVDHWMRWRRKHARTLAALFKALPDSPTRRKLVAIGKAKKAQFERSMKAS